MPFETLPAIIGEALADRGYTELTPVQAAATGADAAGRDLIVSAQTGSGKTVAFGLALADALLGEIRGTPLTEKPLALVIAPTRELALQVSRELGWLYAKAGLRIATCVGGMDASKERRALRSGPAIIVGTVDMIGSRLLFSGYGDGKSRRPMHAGLLGQDALLIHDEAHLSPAFGHLCRQIHALQDAQSSRVAPAFQLIEMTATPGDNGAPTLPLPDQDRANPRVVRRLEAGKTLTLCELDESASPADKRNAMVQAALAHAAKRKARAAVPIAAE